MASLYIESFPISVRVIDHSRFRSVTPTVAKKSFCFRILIKGGEVVNATGREKADVYIEDKTIRYSLFKCAQHRYKVFLETWEKAYVSIEDKLCRGVQRGVFLRRIYT